MFEIIARSLDSKGCSHFSPFWSVRYGLKAAIRERLLLNDCCVSIFACRHPQICGLGLATS